MTGRRRLTRFIVPTAVQGSLRIFDRVTLEEFGEGELRVLSDSPAQTDDLMLLDRCGSSPPLTVPMRVAESDVVMVDGFARHRLRLEILDQHSSIDETKLMGVLVKELPVQLLDVSRDGCLMEAPAQVEVQAHGELNLQIDGRTCRDEVRVVRCFGDGARQGAYRIAAQFVGHVSQHDSAHSAAQSVTRNLKEKTS